MLPADATFQIVLVALVYTMVSSDGEAAPNGRSVSHILTGGPPARATFLIALVAENPIQLPSGEKNGPSAPSVPAMALASSSSSART